MKLFNNRTRLFTTGLVLMSSLLFHSVAIAQDEEKTDSTEKKK
jgi:hypothetical protein